MKKIEMYCSVVKGVLDLDKNALTRQLKGLKDGQYQLTIEPEPNTISNQQRKYFFGVVAKKIILGFAEKGISVNLKNVRILLEDKFIYREEYCPIEDRDIKSRISFANNPKGITKDEFNGIKEKIQQHAMQEWSIEIPDPNEIDYSTKL